MAAYPGEDRFYALVTRDGLIGVMLEGTTDFVCTDCIEEHEEAKVEDETFCTIILSTDRWFSGAVCSRCKESIT